MDDVAAVILVGGKSSRMGQDKALLPYKGKRLVDVVADTIRAAGISRVYVSGKIAEYQVFLICFQGAARLAASVPVF